jgi:hypothetical protein
MILPLPQMALVRNAVRTARAVSEGRIVAINPLARNFPRFAGVALLLNLTLNHYGFPALSRKFFKKC